MLALQPSGSNGNSSKQNRQNGNDNISHHHHQQQQGALGGSRRTNEKKKKNAQNPNKKNVFQSSSFENFGKFESSLKNQHSRSATSQPASTTILTEGETELDSVIGGLPNASSTFTQIKHGNRGLPKFLIYQSPGLNSDDLLQIDSWDKENQMKMESIEEATADLSAIYEDFQKMRDTEREIMEQKGLVDNENIRKTLEDAISFKGSCHDMCPVYERVRRSVENDVRKYEKDDSTGKISKSKAIKAFSRPAAGQPPPLPSDVRPPQILVKTLDYLIDNVVPLLPESQSFIWDRTRSIRQDFTYQNYSGPEAVDCNERIVRLHILSLHFMAKSDVEYSQQQELEQMNKSLKTLSEIYTEYRSRGIEAPNEAEFRAYYLLSQLRDPELEREIQSLSIEILQDERVQLALQLRNLASMNIIEKGFQYTENVLNFYYTLFQYFELGKIPVLMAYLIEIHLNEIRFYALKSIKKSIHNKAKPYPLTYVQQLLAFNDLSDTEDYLRYYGFSIEVVDNVKSVDLVSLIHNSHLIPDQKPLKQAFSNKFESQVSSYKSMINTGVSNTGSLKFEREAKSQRNGLDFFRAPTVQGNSVTTPFGLPVQPSSASFVSQPLSELKNTNVASSFPTLTPTTGDLQSGGDDQVLQAQKQRHAQEALLDRSRIEEEKKLSALKAKEKEAETKRIEENRRLDQMKVTMLKKQEEKKQRLAEFTSVIGSSIQESLIKDVVKTSVESILTPLIQTKLEMKLQRENLLNNFSEGLYEAFVNELIYFESLEILSTLYRERRLKKNFVHLVSEISSKSKKKSDLKKRKCEEFLEVSKDFGIPKVTKRRKRKSIDGNHSLVTNKSYSMKENDQVDMSQFNFDSLLNKCSKQSNRALSLLIFVENSLISKFIDKKFDLNHEVKIVKREAAELKIRKISFIDLKSFSNVNLLIFNITSDQDIYEQKLTLKNVLKGLELNNNYKFEVLIVYWNFQNDANQFTGLSKADFEKNFKIGLNNTVQDLKIIKVNDDLDVSPIQNFFNSLELDVKLSSKGEFNDRYNKNKVNTKSAFPTSSNLKISETSILDESSPANFNINKIDKKNSLIHNKFKTHIEASPKFKKLPVLLSNKNKLPIKSKTVLHNGIINGFDANYQPKPQNKFKIDVYSTPRPKSSELLQTPSFYNDSSTISNLSNVTFDNNSKKDKEIILKKSYAEVVKQSIIKKDEEEDVPKSILELRRLAKSVKEKHGKK